MAHWAGRRDIPDQAYATNARWPQPWQPWQRGAASRRMRGVPSAAFLESELAASESEQEALMSTRAAARYVVFQAILEGDLEPLKQTLKEHPKAVEAKAPGSDCTPIMVAAALGDKSICSELLSSGANLHARDGATGATAFIMAANKGNNEVLSLFLEHVSSVELTVFKLLQETTKKGETALMAAAKSGHVEAVKILLDAGAPIDAMAAKQCHVTALHLAAAKGHADVVEELLSRGAILEDPDDWGIRPAMYAAINGHHACLSQLLKLELPPDLEATDERGRTVALHAAAGGHVEVLQVLEAAGANLRARTLRGSTGFLLACRHAHLAAAQWWLSAEDRTTDINEPNSASRESALHLAVRSKSLELVSWLIDKGCLIEMEDSRGWTPLSLCAVLGWQPGVRLLLDQGASVIVMDAKGRVPRRLAEQYGHADVALLLRRRAQRDLLKPNDDGDPTGDPVQDPQEPHLKSWRLLQGYT